MTKQFFSEQETKCIHCRKGTRFGTHGGCYDCGKVQTATGRIDPEAMKGRMHQARLRFGMTARQRVVASGALKAEV